MVAGPTGGLDPESFAFSNLIIIWGMNPIATSIHHSQFILEAKKQRAILVVIDQSKQTPRSEQITTYAHVRAPM